MVTVRRKNPGAFTVLAKHIQELKGLESKAGWFESAKYADGTPVAYIASIQEFGYPAGGIPPRPFMRPTILQKQKEWQSLMFQGAKAIIAGNETGLSVMDKLAALAAAEVAETISKIFTPPLKPATIAARKRKMADQVTVGQLTKPLIDTGIMFNTITHVTEQKK